MNKEMKQTLNEIIDFEIDMPTKHHAHESIPHIEQQYGVSLPQDYKDFLLGFGGCFIKENAMYQPIEMPSVTPKDGFDSINGFYGCVSNTLNLMSVIQTYKDVLGGSFLPIADADGGDLICMGLKGEYEGRICYWYHEGDTGENGQEYYYLVANSFEEFIRKFSLHEREQPVNLDDIDLFLLDED
ncbi:SMI1/KNR4 family protein [Rossellomorea marisflavi]|uniref:SMI1/KNR4 family protein n=1 Tax=Rossellomorea marisflavi TaxID=189381 RepID=UPI00064FDE00|nr:SMI1/KNR4 family protein [Rossellomorea marisflavi]KMK95079.1 hypothetical protein VL03_09930 [Rossellomorea marisflavi]